MDIEQLLGIDYSDPSERLARDLVLADEQLLEDLIDARKRAGMSQEDVAGKMGVTPSAVSRVESGERDVRLSTLRRYAHAVGVRVTHDVENREQEALKQAALSGASRTVRARVDVKMSSVRWAETSRSGTIRRKEDRYV